MLSTASAKASAKGFKLVVLSDAGDFKSWMVSRSHKRLASDGRHFPCSSPDWDVTRNEVNRFNNNR